jgi:ubiquitin-conjugating enzyme E2 variant
MKNFLSLMAQTAGVVFAAEFVAGIVHWLEDAYIREDTPIIGKALARSNIVHHHYPRHMTRYNWWYTSGMLVVVSACIVAAAWLCGLLTWHVWLFALISANANEIHKWAHRTRKENGVVISFLQDARILQTTRHHALHHTDPKNSHYCTVTNFLNPILDGLDFWNRVEYVLERTLGLKRREDTSVRGHGPGPKWLAEFAPKRTAAA